MHEERPWPPVVVVTTESGVTLTLTTSKLDRVASALSRAEVLSPAPLERAA